MAGSSPSGPTKTSSERNEKPERGDTMAKGGQKSVHEVMRPVNGPVASLRSAGRATGTCSGCGGVLNRALVENKMKDVCFGKEEMKDSDGKVVSAATNGCGNIYPRAGKGNQYGSA